MASGSRKTESLLEAKAKHAGWTRFSLVKSEFVPEGQKLYRSSAPSYTKRPGGDHDASQNLTSQAVKFLVEQNIDSIISFNRYEYKPAEKETLATARIMYLHLRVDDWCAPNLQQLKQANEFFIGKSSTLLHCGYGHGRTGTGVTALQICASNGQMLEPYASTWWGSRGNHVEKRRQMSILAELRNTLLQNRIMGIPDGDPIKEFAIINLATGYYLTIQTNTVIALSPETVEISAMTCAHRKYRWIVRKDKATNNFQLSNSATAGRFAVTEPGSVNIDDPVMLGTGEGANTQFTITETQAREISDRGFYIVSPSPNPNLAIAIKEPNDNFKRLNESRMMPALLATKDETNKFGLWVLLPVYARNPVRQ